MKYRIFLFALICSRPHSVSAMEQSQLPEYFQNLVCPDLDEPIDKQTLLNENPFWKKVAKTARPEEKDNYLRQTLKLSCDDPVWEHHRKTIACTLAAGANPDIKNDSTALIEAIRKNDYSLLTFALQCNADPSIKWNNTTLFFFARTVKVAKLLIKHNVNVLSRADDDETFLHQVALHSEYSPDLIPYYVQQKIDVNAQNRVGNTPIMYTVSHYHNFNATKFRLLLEHGADVTIKNKYGHTVWSIAHSTRLLEQAQKIYEQFQQKRTAYGL